MRNPSCPWRKRQSRETGEYVAAAATGGVGRSFARVHGMAVGISGDSRVVVISKETECEILRLHYVEKWRKGTIAAQLHVHHSTVERVLTRNGVNAEQMRIRRSVADGYVDFITSTLKEWPRLNAKRLYVMARERGYPGGPDWFRKIVSRYRPRTSERAHLRLQTLPGEQAQVDWASFGKIKIGEAERKLYGFVMVLSWSRHIFLRFYVNQGMANFERGHIDAFEFFGGAGAKKCLYDNCKVVVRERVGSAILYNPELLAFAGHYHFEPIAVAQGQAEQKGRVERGIRYVRTSFWPARKWTDIADLNRQAIKWCVEEAGERDWIQDKKMKVREAFEREKPYLHSHSMGAYPVYDRREVHVGKTPFIRFDGNWYSVPARYVKATLSVFATLEEVMICDGLEEIARHGRSFEKEKQIETTMHSKEVVEEKRAAREHRNMSRLQAAAPSSAKFFKEAALRGQNLGRLTQQLNGFLDLYGAAEFEAALGKAIQAGRTHAAAVQTFLEQERGARGLNIVPTKLYFQNNVLANELVIAPKTLEGYGCLFSEEEDVEE